VLGNAQIEKYQHLKNMFIHLIIPILYAVPFFFVFADKLLYLQFCLGLLCGYLLFVLDRLLHVFFIQPDSDFSQRIRQQWQQRQYGLMVKTFLTNRQQQSELMTRSVIFLIVYVALAIYVITSTGSVLGAGLILGIGLHFCLDFWRYRQDENAFHRHFLWQLKKKIIDNEVTYLVISFTIFFVLISLMVIKMV
jgi:hypothetical protein